MLSTTSHLLFFREEIMPATSEGEIGVRKKHSGL